MEAFATRARLAWQQPRSYRRHRRPLDRWSRRLRRLQGFRPAPRRSSWARSGRNQRLPRPNFRLDRAGSQSAGVNDAIVQFSLP